jgi:hypothetical protein
MSGPSRSRLSVEFLELRAQPANFAMGMIFITPPVDPAPVVESRTQGDAPATGTDDVIVDGPIITAEDVDAAVGASKDIVMKGSKIGENTTLGANETITVGGSRTELSGWGSSMYQYSFEGTYF